MAGQKRKTQQQRVFDYLVSGKTLTASQASSRFGVRNMRAVADNIRKKIDREDLPYEVYTEDTARSTCAYGICEY